MAAVITYFSVRISDKPADSDHHFGHGKVENFSAFIETILLLITCAWIVYEASHRLLTGNTHIEVNAWSYVVVVVSIIIDISRSRALNRVAKKYNSQALEADALHFSTDIWSSFVVLIGLICANMGIYDCIAALIVALLVVYISYKLGRRSMNVLLDRVPEDIYHRVNEVVKKNEDIRFFHDLKIRSSGADVFTEVTIHVDPELKIGEAHDITTQQELQIKKAVDRCQVHIHTEPDRNEHE